MKLFRPGIYEYDKRTVRATKQCAKCGADINATPRKKFCGPCYATSYDENIARNRAKYRGRVYGKKKAKPLPLPRHEVTGLPTHRCPHDQE